MHEHRTAGIAAKHLQDNGYDVASGVGNTGVVGLLRNGDGPTVMLRADMDALPIREATGLDYASTATAEDANGNLVPVAHACGHDMHVAWLMGVTALFSQQRDAWRGTLVTVFQPGEETAQGARAMIADGLLDRFPKPDVVLGQHVMVGPVRHHRRQRRPDHICRRQPANSPVRPRRARLYAAGERRSHCHGSSRCSAFADHRCARSRRERCRRGDGGSVASRLKGECDSRRSDHQTQRAHIR